MTPKQRRWYYAQMKRKQGISASSFKDTDHPTNPTTGIKVTPSGFIKKPKEEKVTDKFGFNAGFVHYDHSVETTFDLRSKQIE